jgi:hypothetical protein
LKDLNRKLIAGKQDVELRYHMVMDAIDAEITELEDDRLSDEHARVARYLLERLSIEPDQDPEAVEDHATEPAR